MTPPTDTEILNAMNGKLHTLEKQGFVKRAGLELFERHYVMKFDVIE